MSCIDAPMERQALQPLTNKGAAGGLSRRKKANKRVDDEISITKRYDTDPTCTRVRHTYDGCPLLAQAPQASATRRRQG
eukprot:COSAG01_NODE_2430_length_7711_cov_182.453100_1_plen_79_part_00